MVLAQGTIIIDVTMEKGKLQEILKAIQAINDYNVEMSEINIPTGTGLHNLKVDNVSVEWVDIVDDNGVQIYADNEEEKLTV
jgi:hypothetical protein